MAAQRKKSPGLLAFCSWLRRRGGGETSSSTCSSLFIDLKTLEVATDHFSTANRLGEGGFGPVYKGVMGDGLEVAVKRLSLDSRQGVREFINEVRLLLKVQHRNVVSLLGCCAHQKMLVYPFFPKLSLDRILFDKSKNASLEWSKRLEIILGVAKGLLYLHEESPVKIIHRDIKASNILLDDNLCPKISDFGMARLFSEDATHVNTFKISGTYGYMAPEYAMKGYLSAKADVFSFGILVLEIVSGRKNLDTKLDEERCDLLSYTSKLFAEGKMLEIVDPSMKTFNRDEAALCIQLGLLCCQAIVADRPDMYVVQLMLSGDSSTLPNPGRPGVHGRMGNWMTTTTSERAWSSGTTRVSNESSSEDDYSRNTISVSFATEGR